jgi:hypothetical protein
MTFRNPRYTALGSIDGEIEHPQARLGAVHRRAG